MQCSVKYYVEIVYRENLSRLNKNNIRLIEHLKSCICGENVFITLVVEPVKPEYFKNIQYCIVQCKSEEKCTSQSINIPV